MRWQRALGHRQQRYNAKSNSDDGVGCILIIVFGVALLLSSYIGWTATISLFVGLVVLTVAGVVWTTSVRQRNAQLAAEHRQQQYEAEEARRAEEYRRSEQLHREKFETEVDSIATAYDSIEALHYMTGAEFESFMADFLEMQGYEVQQLAGSGDQGVDLILTTGDRRIAVQLKRYARPLGNKPIQEVFAGRFIHSANEAWVITTSSFTKGGFDAARKTQVRLIDGAELFAWTREANQEMKD